jgi:hypothetical protein
VVSPPVQAKSSAQSGGASRGRRAGMRASVAQDVRRRSIGQALYGSKRHRRARSLSEAAPGGGRVAGRPAAGRVR